MTVSSTVHGFPRIGDRRELKTATEGYWAGRVPAEELEATARELRRQAWTFLRVTERTIDCALERGDMARRREGGRTLIPRASLRALVMQQAGVLPVGAGVGFVAVSEFGGTQTSPRFDTT